MKSPCQIYEFWCSTDLPRQVFVKDCKPSNCCCWIRWPPAVCMLAFHKGWNTTCLSLFLGCRVKSMYVNLFLSCAMWTDIACTNLCTDFMFSENAEVVSSILQSLWKALLNTQVLVRSDEDEEISTNLMKTFKIVFLSECALCAQLVQIIITKITLSFSLLFPFFLGAG